MWIRSLGWVDPLKEDMATHPSVLAWRTPWTEEPGGLQSLGPQSPWTSKGFLDRLKDQGFVHKAVGVAYLPFTRQNVSALEILE